MRNTKQVERLESELDGIMWLISYEIPDQMQHVLKCASTDERLIVLIQHLNRVAVQTMQVIHGSEKKQINRNRLRDSLANIAAFAFVWICSDSNPSAWDFRELQTIERIHEERERQRALFKERKISFDVASPIIDLRRKFRVLAEEVGEVAHAIDQIENHGMAQGNLNMELVQVAAVAVAWLESLEGGTQELRNGGAR